MPGEAVSGVSEAWSWDSQSPTICLGSPLQALAYVWFGGSVSCLVWGCLQGLLLQAITCIPAVVRAAEKQSRRGGTAWVPKWAMVAIPVSWCVSRLPFTSTVSSVPEIWLVIDQYELKKWCQPELWIYLLLSVCHSFIAALAQCVHVKAQYFCHPEKSLANVLRNSFQCREAQGSLSSHRLVQTSDLLSSQRTT